MPPLSRWSAPRKRATWFRFKLSATNVQSEEGEPEVLIPEGTYQMVAGERRATQEEWPYEGFNEELIGMSCERDQNRDPHLWRRDSV
jgi:hypothetical protein